MKFKGIPSLDEVNKEIKKLKIIIPQKPSVFVRNECLYENGLMIYNADFVNWEVIERSYDDAGNITKESISTFQDNPQKKDLESVLYNEFEGNQRVESTYFEYDSKEEATQVYTKEYEYQKDRLSKEIYIYLDSEYVIEYRYSDSGDKMTTIYPGNQDNEEYHFDADDRLTKYMRFKKKSCKVHEYRYKDNRLDQMIEYPFLAFKKRPSNGEIILGHNKDFVMVHSHTYLPSGLVDSITKEDTLNKAAVDKFVYKYEQH